jgi:pectin methylesterase-like acyl-CoA thioesterase
MTLHSSSINSANPKAIEERNKDMETTQVDTVVVADDNGNFKNINTAIAAASLKSSKRHAIHIKSGIYNELVIIEKSDIMFMGDMDKMPISSSHCNTDDHNTQDTSIVSKCIPPP